jgi:hypothetical protein
MSPALASFSRNRHSVVASGMLSSMPSRKNRVNDSRSCPQYSSSIRKITITASGFCRRYSSSFPLVSAPQPRCRRETSPMASVDRLLRADRPSQRVQPTACQHRAFLVRAPRKIAPADDLCKSHSCWHDSRRPEWGNWGSLMRAISPCSRYGNIAIRHACG